MTRWSTVTLAVVGALGLGCSGLAGYGEEAASAALVAGEPFTLTWTPAVAGDHEVWLKYEVEHTAPFRVQGPLQATLGASTLGTWTLDLTASGSPIVGQEGSTTLMSHNLSVNGRGSAGATAWLVTLPALPAGEPVTLSGTFTPDAGTTIQELRLTVTR